MPPAGTVRAFISYARADGEAFATGLRRRLETEEPEITLWQDRARMEGGVGWWKQIAEALESVQFLIVAMTPAALQSETTRKEWRSARQQGVRVCPVKGRTDTELDYRSLPSWMRKVHFYDLDKEWETFVNYLKSPSQASRVPFMAPDLPAAFVQRPGPFRELMGVLLDVKRENPVAVTTALHGAGGLGKTTLAVALCHDDDVITAFDDGILWATLGQTPNITAELTKLYAALTGERPGFIDAEDAAGQLARRLEDKACLIVLDDVWDPAHLRPFLRGGRGCARLITTRQFEVARDVARVKVKEMRASEAVRLLTAQFEPPPSDRAPFDALAERLGQWPLLLKLTGGTLRERLQRGDTLEGALAYVNTALDKRGLTAFDKDAPTDRHQAVQSTLAVSLDLLSKQHRQRCAELAVFAEDARVPLSTIQALWGMEAFDTEELLQRLADVSLVELDLRADVVTVHDVIRAFLQREMPDATALHKRLLHAWGDPRQLRDRYAWRWLAYHLTQARQSEELRRLLLDFDWIRAKLVAMGIEALISDYDHLTEDGALRLVHGALRLSAHVLAKDPSQLRSQLYGRLVRSSDPSVSALVERIEASGGSPWLRPLPGALTPAGGPLLRILSGHAGVVTAVAVTPDGKFAVSGSWDKTVKVWELATGEEKLTLRGHSDWVTAVAVTPDGERVVSASRDSKLKVWDLVTGEERLTIVGHADRATAVAVTPDGNAAVSGSGDKVLKVWDLATGDERVTLAGHSSWITAVAVTLDGRRVVSASGDRTLRVWDLASGDQKLILTGHSQEVTAVAVTADGETAISASADRTLKVWDLASGKEKHSLTGHCGPVTAVAVTPDGKWAVSASGDKALRIWDLANGKELLSLAGHLGEVTAVAVTPDGRRAVSASEDATLRVWDLAGGESRVTLAGHVGWVIGLAMAPDGQSVISASRDATLKVWDTASGQEKLTLSGHSGWVTAVAVTPDGKRALSASGDMTLRLWDLTDGTAKLALAGHSGWVNGVAITRDGTEAVSASADKTLRLWNLETGELKCILAGHADGLIDVAITPDGRHAISASRDNTLKVWDLGRRVETLTLTGHSGWVIAVAVTPDGKRAISASHDNTLKVWDLATGDVMLTLRLPSREFAAVTTTLDGRRAVTVSWDDTLRVWDLGTGDLVTAFSADDRLAACAVGPDGTSLVAAGASGRLHFLRLEGLVPNAPR
jgi:WD40 repeat protein